MRTPELLPDDRYEVYPGCSPPDFARWFLEHNPIKLEKICMSEGIDFDAIPGLVDAVLDEWEFKEERHRDQRDALIHMLNHIRVKKSYAKRNAAPPRNRIAPRTDAERTAEDIGVAQAILRRLNPDKG